MDKKNKFIKKIDIFLYIIFMILICISIIYIINFSYDIYETKQDAEKIAKISEHENTSTNTNINFQNTNIVQDINNTKSERTLQLEELQKINSDIIGWLEIENTQINYPVLQTTDNSYYMNHNYKKEQSKNGSIFLDKDFSWDPPSSNLLIYGHNMKNNTMFEDLLKYKDKNFYKKHPTIRFTTNTEDVNYEIISVFESRVFYKSEKNVFRYYYFVNSQNETEYNNFVENAKKSSLYYIPTTAKYGDQLMTLSTCSYHTKNGRFAVIAKKK